MDHFTPAPAVGAARNPLAPELDGLLESPLPFFCRQHDFPSVRLGKLLQDEGSRLVFFEHEFSGHARARSLERNRGCEPQAEICRAEACAARSNLDGMFVTGIVERRFAFHAERHLPARDVDIADDGMLLDRRHRRPDRHEVGDLGDTLGREKAGDENVGIGPVETLRRDPVGSSGADGKMPALLVVQNAGEDAGGIEVGKTEPINRTIHADEGDRPHVPDDAVVLDGLVGQAVSLLGQPVSVMSPALGSGPLF